MAVDINTTLAKAYMHLPPARALRAREGREGGLPPRRRPQAYDAATLPRGLRNEVTSTTPTTPSFTSLVPKQPSAGKPALMRRHGKANKNKK